MEKSTVIISTVSSAAKIHQLINLILHFRFQCSVSRKSERREYIYIYFVFQRILVKRTIRGTWHAMAIN